MTRGFQQSFRFDHAAAGIEMIPSSTARGTNASAACERWRESARHQRRQNMDHRGILMSGDRVSYVPFASLK